MSSDAEWMARWRNGDEVAQERLLREYESALFSYLARMLGSVYDAEDVAQKTMVQVVRKLPGYREEGKFKGWLFRIAHRKALRVIRRRRIKPTESLDDPSRPVAVPADDSSGNPRVNAHGSERRQRLYAAMETLPQHEKEVVLLRIHGELSFKEIARVTGCPLNTALGRMHNATRRLRRLLAANGDEGTPP